LKSAPRASPMGTMSETENWDRPIDRPGCSLSEANKANE
jgi:hypothetical protein